MEESFITDDWQNCKSFPKYTANMILEFHEENKDQYLKVRYNGDHVKICEGKDMCLLTEFWERIDWLLK